MARPRKSEKQKLACKLDIRVTHEEAGRIEAAARAIGLSRTDYLRVLIFERLPKRAENHASLIPPEIKAELCRQGANLRDLYNRNNARGMFDAEASARILRAIGSEIEKICVINDHYIKNVIIGGDTDDRKSNN